MNHRSLFVLSLLLVVFILTTPDLFAQELQHFDPPDWHPGDMSVIVRSRTLDDEQLVEGDEIGVFTEAGLCVGASVVEVAWDPEDLNTQLGISVVPDDDPDNDTRVSRLVMSAGE